MNLELINKLIEQESAAGRRIIFVDASSLKDTGCWRKYFWSAIKGYKYNNEDDGRSALKMNYGSAIHKFLEHWYLGKDKDFCVNAATKYYEGVLGLYKYNLEQDEYEFRTMSHLEKAIEHYQNIYPRDVDGLKAIHTEQKFCFPIWQNSMYVIMLTGTIDLIGTYHDIPIIVDHKSTASYSTSGYFDQYELNIQTMFYSYVWNLLHPEEENRYRGVVINGIFIKKPTQKAAKEGRWDGVKFERSRPFEYTEDQMKMFKDWLAVKLFKLQSYLGLSEDAMKESLEADYDLTFCKTPFGLCKFFGVCKAAPSLQPVILSNNFVTSIYNPLTFGGGPD